MQLVEAGEGNVRRIYPLFSPLRARCCSCDPALLSRSSPSLPPSQPSSNALYVDLNALAAPRLCLANRRGAYQLAFLSPSSCSLPLSTTAATALLSAYIQILLCVQAGKDAREAGAMQKGGTNRERGSREEPNLNLYASSACRRSVFRPSWSVKTPKETLIRPKSRKRVAASSKQPCEASLIETGHSLPAYH